jgi:hypothetical protein
MPKILFHNPEFKLHFKRSDSVQVEYNYQLYKLQKEGITPSEHILTTYFKEGQLISFVENQFPYDFGDDYQHWLLFAKEEALCNLVRIGQRFTSKNDVNFEYLGVQTLIEYMFDPSKIQAIWINDEKDQSVKDLKHYHFVIKKYDPNYNQR